MRRIKLILAAAASTAALMMVVALPPALAYPYDFTYGTGPDYCYYGCGSFSSPPTDTTSTEEDLDDFFLDDDDGFVCFRVEGFLVCGELD